MAIRDHVLFEPGFLRGLLRISYVPRQGTHAFAGWSAGHAWWPQAARAACKRAPRR